MFVTKLKTLCESGDTIVEVLIAIAVISLILGGAFVLTNRSLQGERDAQERVNALKLTETQIEQIRGIAASNPNALFGATNPFCLINNQVSTGTSCIVDIDGNPDPSASVQPAFTLSVTRNGNAFTALTKWVSVNGRLQNNVQLEYRAYQ